MRDARAVWVRFASGVSSERALPPKASRGPKNREAVWVAVFSLLTDSFVDRKLVSFHSMKSLFPRILSFLLVLCFLADPHLAGRDFGIKSDIRLPPSEIHFTAEALS